MDVKRILVVDDELQVRQLLTLILTTAGYQVETAADGAEALEKIAAEPFDLIVTDMRMPGMTGQELARELRARRASPRIILVTGYSPGPDYSSFDAVIAKPFSAGRLRAAVSNVLGANRDGSPPATSG